MNNYKPVGKVGEGTFYHALKAPTLRDGKCYACNHRKPHFESFQPLFPVSNELDQIPKIHDVIGTSANKTLDKFKQAADLQTLAMHKKLRVLGNTSGQVTLHLWQRKNQVKTRVYFQLVPQQSEEQNCSPKHFHLPAVERRRLLTTS